jgi:hypothetical protein
VAGPSAVLLTSGSMPARRRNHSDGTPSATGALKAALTNGGQRADRTRRCFGFFLQAYAHVLRNDGRDAAEQAVAFLLCNGWIQATKTIVR